MFLIFVELMYSSFFLTSLKILMTFYVSLLAPRKMASIFLSHVFQKWLYVLHSRSDFIYLRSHFNFFSSETCFCLNVLGTSLQLIKPYTYVVERRGILSTFSFSHPLPIYRPFLERIEFRQYSCPRFWKLTWVWKVAVVITVFFSSYLLQCSMFSDS